MPRGFLQKSPSLNYLGHNLADSRCHGDSRYLPPHHYHHPGVATAAAAVVAADVDDERQGRHRLFPLMALFLVNHVGKICGFMSRIKAL